MPDFEDLFTVLQVLETDPAGGRLRVNLAMLFDEVPEGWIPWPDAIPRSAASGSIWEGRMAQRARHLADVAADPSCLHSFRQSPPPPTLEALARKVEEREVRSFHLPPPGDWDSLTEMLRISRG